MASLATDYNVTAQTLIDLQTKITAYSGAVGKPALAKSSKQAAGVTLESALANVDKVLVEKLDKHVQRIRTSQHTFFETYTAARSIVGHPGGRSKAKPDGNGNGGTPSNN